MASIGDDLSFEKEDSDLTLTRRVREHGDISKSNPTEEEMEEGEISGPEETNSRPALFTKSARSGLQITIKNIRDNFRDDQVDKRHLPVRFIIHPGSV